MVFDEKLHFVKPGFGRWKSEANLVIIPGNEGQIFNSERCGAVVKAIPFRARGRRFNA